MSTISVILLIGALIWFWLDSARARELAVGICSESCNRAQLQFLDQTVALRRLGIRWTPQGIRVRRTFQFDYSEEGEGRHQGRITLVGIQLEAFSFETHPRGDNIVPLRQQPKDRQH